MKRLRLVLGDQLNLQHSWYTEVDDNVTYLLAEMRQETDYVTHHIQKVVAFFLSMRNFAGELEKRGHRVVYLKINDPGNDQGLDKILPKYIASTGAGKLEYQYPDEYRLDKQLKAICSRLEIANEAFGTEHFYTSRHDLRDFFEGKEQLVMENFYRMMRKKHGILIQQGKPEGGQWNFDKSNRKKWTGEPAIPRGLTFDTDIRPVLREVEEAGIRTIGQLKGRPFNWPTSREESIAVLHYFCTELLPYFGDFQDAMLRDEKFLFHSRLSFALNSKMLSPKEVIDRVLRQYRQQQARIHISQVEGFVRQVLGWREFMRGIYWREMPGYRECNALENHHELPDFFWTGKTKMECLSRVITQSLEEGYAHHIQRLMVTGNFALLAQVAPEAVDQWYLGVYIDAIEWVELPNTRGMSQFADGGLVATKPYVSSANYIQKMSDYCSHCAYSPAQKVGDGACPFNALYWNFLDEKRLYFKDNQRMSLMLSLLDKKGEDELAQLKERARAIIATPDRY